MSAICANYRIGLELALRLQRFRGHHHYRSLPTACHFLTILAVTVVSGNYLLAIKMISGAAAKASARNNIAHNAYSQINKMEEAWSLPQIMFFSCNNG